MWLFTFHTHTKKKPTAVGELVKTNRRVNSLASIIDDLNIYFCIAAFSNPSMLSRTSVVFKCLSDHKQFVRRALRVATSRLHFGTSRCVTVYFVSRDISGISLSSRGIFSKRCEPPKRRDITEWLACWEKPRRVRALLCVPIPSEPTDPIHKHIPPTPENTQHPALRCHMTDSMCMFSYRSQCTLRVCSNEEDSRHRFVCFVAVTLNLDLEAEQWGWMSAWTRRVGGCCVWTFSGFRFWTAQWRFRVRLCAAQSARFVWRR